MMLSAPALGPAQTAAWHYALANPRRLVAGRFEAAQLLWMVVFAWRRVSAACIRQTVTSSGYHGLCALIRQIDIVFLKGAAGLHCFQPVVRGGHGGKI